MSLQFNPFDRRGKTFFDKCQDKEKFHWKKSDFASSSTSCLSLSYYAKGETTIVTSAVSAYTITPMAFKYRLVQ